MERLEQQITTFKRLRAGMCTLGAKLLLLDGSSEEMTILHFTNQRVSHTITSLEDLSLIASEGYEPLERAYGNVMN